MLSEGSCRAGSPPQCAGVSDCQSDLNQLRLANRGAVQVPSLSVNGRTKTDLLCSCCSSSDAVMTNGGVHMRGIGLCNAWRRMHITLVVLILLHQDTDGCGAVLYMTIGELTTYQLAAVAQYSRILSTYSLITVAFLC